MNYIKYASIALFAGGLFAYAAQNPDNEKVRNKQSVTTQVVKSGISIPVMSIDGKQDGIPYGLYAASINDKDVTIRWNNPEPVDGYFEDFEGHPDFEINSPGAIGWEYMDLDNQSTVTWQAAVFPNQGQKMAFLVMNPSKTSPSVAERPGFKPYSGNKMLVTFAANTPGVANNDYIISPLLNFEEDFQISFRAKAYTEQYGKERIRIGYSTTGKSPSNFTFVNDGPYVEIGADDWQLIQYSIPKEAKYVTINCVSNDAFIFMLDDIFIGTNKVRPQSPAKNKLTGFNVYRDGVKVNDTPVTEVFYDDTVSEYGTYEYRVTALYEDGSESDKSEPLSVNVPDVRLIPFEDDFSTWTLDPEKWSTPVDEQGNESQWIVDYYTYGLVDPSATYKFSRLTNYSQSLITRELRTTEPDNTYLRFELRLLNYNTIDGDTLSVEISTDNRNWKNIQDFTNDEGSYAWRVYQYSLKEYLQGNEIFYVRFRAHGKEAFYIDYWYVDDIKIWNPEWAKATLSVNHNGNPVAQCPVVLTADHGARLNETTDASGNIEFDQIEKGNYEVEIVLDGYNIYKNVWNLQDESDHFQADITAPQMQISDEEISVDMATESKTTAKMTITNNGDGPMDWILTPRFAANSGKTGDRWKVLKTFDTSGDLQSSIAFDGEYFYTTSWYHMNKFYKYDIDGNFIDEFSIEGIYYSFYDFAFDGQYFYASDKTNVIYQLDLKNKRFVGTINVNDPDVKITHCSYDPTTDQFWVGSFNSIGRVDRQGNVKVSFRKISEDNTMAAYGSAYDNVTPGGPYLWLSNQNTTDESPLDQVLISQYNLNTRKIVSTHIANDIPGYKPGTEEMGGNYLNGIEITQNLEDGSVVLLGILQQSPARVFAYKMCESNNWLTVNTKAGTIEPGSSQDITFGMDTKDAKLNDSYEMNFRLMTVPDKGAKDITVKCNVTSSTPYPRPLSLKADMQGDADVRLTWKDGDDNRQPDGYNIYRNNVKINTALVTDKEYTDNNVLRGDYDYTVTAVYNGSNESIHSTAANIHVKVGTPYYAPTGLTASVEQNKYVILQWNTPDHMTTTPVNMKWDDGTNYSSIGSATDLGYFYAGVKWDADDLADYRGMIIDKVNVFVQERVRAFSLKIFKDGNAIYTQQIQPDDILYGNFNTIQLDEEIIVEPGCEYIVAFIIVHDTDLRPIGVDNTAIIEGKGCLLSENGKDWISATRYGMSKGNLNVSIDLLPNEGYESPKATGYNIYRDGQYVNSRTADKLTYTDEVTQPGIYNYQVTATYDENRESSMTSSAKAEIINIGTRHAPDMLVADVQYNRTIRLHWSQPMGQESSFPYDLTQMNITCKEGYPEYVNMFRGYIASEYGINSDGQYIYTSMFKTGGVINKYTLDGQFLESFDINSAMQGIRNLAYDGEYFYAADYNSCIYKIDMERKTVTDTISVSEIARHLTYIPELDNGRGGFEVGDWNTSIYITKNGAKIGDGISFKAASGTAYFNGIIYAFEQDHENPYVISMYDFQSGDLIRSIDLKEYIEISPETGASGGGMSVIETKEGLHLLAVTLQEPSNARHIFFDIEGIRGVAGYNIYCNGNRLNDQPVRFRYYEDTQSEVGEYSYEIETVYIDNTVSGKSQKATVEIVDADHCESPASVKVTQMSYPYNVTISYVDPLASDADIYESFEQTVTGDAYDGHGWINTDNKWTVTEDAAYDGMKAITCGKDDMASMIIPTEEYVQGAALSFVARNADDHNGNGQLSILTSKYTSSSEDFVAYMTINTSEAWKQYDIQLPEGTKHVAIRHDAGTNVQYIDAIKVNDTFDEHIYGYDIYRNGEKINDQPVSNISYTDYNLLPGTYEYQVMAYYNTSCISDLSEPVSIDLDYSNDCQAPGTLFAEKTEQGTLLTWSAPALGDVINLKWHSGNAYDAAGLPSGGCYYAGVQWTAEDLAPYGNLSLAEIEVYVNQVPDAMFVMVYQGTTLVCQQYVPEVRQYSFNTIVLDNPVQINTTRTLRVVVYVEHNEISIPLGYDEGPAVSGKGNLYSADGVTWETLADNEIYGNWNITLGLKAYAAGNSIQQTAIQPVINRIKAQSGMMDTRLVSTPLKRVETSMRNTMDGYNVYCNSELLNDTPLTTTTYLDTNTYNVNYIEYQVTAIYSGCGEVGSNKVTLRTSGIEDMTTGQLTAFKENDLLIIRGAECGALIQIYDTNARMVYTDMAGSASDIRIDVTEWTEGLYVVRSGNQTLKVMIHR